MGEGALFTERRVPDGGYMPQLDGLRAVAIALVLYAHLTPHSLWLLNIDWASGPPPMAADQNFSPQHLNAAPAGYADRIFCDEVYCGARKAS